MASNTKPLINLIRGWPHPSLLPSALLQKAAQRALSKPEVSVPGLLYGPDNGFEPLRHSIAEWLTEFYHSHPTASTTTRRRGGPVRADRITITGGASQNLGCVLQVFTDPVFTRNVWIVAPAYMLAFRMFDDAGLGGKMRAVPEDEEGIDVGYLEKQIKRSDERAAVAATAAAKSEDGCETVKPERPWGKFYRHIIYAVPTFSNPSTKTMSLRRREEVIRLARRHDALIITDDVYDFLQWPASANNNYTDATSSPPPTEEEASCRSSIEPRIVDVDRYLDGGAEREGADGFGNAASNGTFTKICGPGVRTGWVEATPKFAWGVSQAGTSRSGGAPSQLTATFMNELLETGDLQRHVYDTLQPAYAKRHKMMLAAMEQHLFPLGVRLAHSHNNSQDYDKVETDAKAMDGGYFFWVTLPSQVTSAGADVATVVARRAKDDENLMVAQGAMFEVPGDEASAKFPHHLRLCFAWEDEDKLEEGIRRLAKVIRALQLEGRDDGAGAGAGAYVRQSTNKGNDDSRGDGNNERNFW